jgi:methyl-accepting chemotaxis protein
MDFTESEEQRKLILRKDEIGSMGRALNELRRELVAVVQDLQRQSQSLHETSEKLQGQAMETAGAIDQVDSAVHDIADGATSQANETQSATENVIVMGSMIQQSNGSIQNIRGNSEEIHDSALAASETLGQLTEINTRVKKAIDEIYQQTHTTNESATKIQEAAALITSIAEETNLLSLNASIEAARAGEHGKGFAVVANQIQKLAEQSNESANRIEGIISVLLEDSQRSVATMEEVREVVEQQDLSVKKTSEIFRTVQDGIDISLRGIEKISEDTGKMDEARVGVTDTVQNLTAIAEENAASTQETSASVTQVRASVDTISLSANGLNDIAVGLEEAMRKFKI